MSGRRTVDSLDSGTAPVKGERELGSDAQGVNLKKAVVGAAGEADTCNTPFRGRPLHVVMPLPISVD